MRCRQFNYTHLAANLILAAFFVPAPAWTSQIQYSWLGTLVPTGDDDPWGLGEDGKSFQLEIVVSRDEIDLLDQNVEFAAHVVDDVHLVIDDMDISYISNGIVDFTDNPLIQRDILAFIGEFEFAGSVIEIGSSVVLPLNTFEFSSLVERPPLFDFAVNVDVSAFGARGPYAGVVAEGASVSAVPEPTVLVNLVLFNTWFTITSSFRKKTS